jgi:hypothetical protein
VPDGDGPWSVTVTIGSGLDRVSEQVIVSRSDGTLLGEARIFRARPAPRAPLRPVATRQFTRLERVHVEWPILAALERREARLLDARGQPLAAPVVVSEIAEPVAAVAADLPLGPLAPGDYVIELTAAAAGHSVLRYVAFRITQ